MTGYRQAAIYGVTTAGVVFFIGWTTGMGGSLVPNIGFSVLMGVFAGLLFTLVAKYARPRHGSSAKGRGRQGKRKEKQD